MRARTRALVELAAIVILCVSAYFAVQWYRAVPSRSVRLDLTRYQEIRLDFPAAPFREPATNQLVTLIAFDVESDTPWMAAELADGTEARFEAYAPDGKDRLNRVVVNDAEEHLDFVFKKSALTGEVPVDDGITLSAWRQRFTSVSQDLSPSVFTTEPILLKAEHARALQVGGATLDVLLARSGNGADPKIRLNAPEAGSISIALPTTLYPRCRLTGKLALQTGGINTVAVLARSRLGAPEVALTLDSPRSVARRSNDTSRGLVQMDAPSNPFQLVDTGPLGIRVSAGHHPLRMIADAVSVVLPSCDGIFIDLLALPLASLSSFPVEGRVTVGVKEQELHGSSVRVAGGIFRLSLVQQTGELSLYGSGNAVVVNDVALIGSRWEETSEPLRAVLLLLATTALAFLGWAHTRLWGSLNPRRSQRSTGSEKT